MKEQNLTIERARRAGVLATLALAGATPITDLSTIHAGDIIAVKYPSQACSSGTTGHVMVAGAPGVPVGTQVGRQNGARWEIPVYDAYASTSGAHSSDFRQNGGAIGVGTVSFTYDADNAPVYFYWTATTSKPSPTACWPSYTSVVAIGRFSD
jgi:hypothetical protein